MSVDKYAVIGNPISHSKSPVIHNMFAESTCEQITYDKLFSEIEKFDATVSDFFQHGGKGMNVTVPFKLDAMTYADNLTERASLAEAVNTLILNADSTVTGDNTDGAGIVRDITANLKVSLTGKRLLILGAGGAVRGILPPITAEQPVSITIANRTVSKAIALAEKFNQFAPCTACGFDDITGQFDIIINGSSAGLTGSLPSLSTDLLTQCTLAYDLVYASEDTEFIRWAKSHSDCKTADGLGMLVEQAAESFYLWRGTRPDTQPVIDALR